MQTLRLPSEKDIREACKQGEDAVLALFQATFSALAERIQKLEDQLAKNSRNSGKPPSSDGYDQPAPKSLRKRRRRQSGGETRPCQSTSGASLCPLWTLVETAQSTWP